MHIFFRVFVFKKHEFCANLAYVYFHEYRLKENFCVYLISAKSTKIRKIHENLYTQKLVRLTYKLNGHYMDQERFEFLSAYLNYQ